MPLTRSRCCHNTKMLQGLPVWYICNQHSEGGGSETHCISPVAFLRPDCPCVSCSMISSYAGGYVGKYNIVPLYRSHVFHSQLHFKTPLLSSEPFDIGSCLQRVSVQANSSSFLKYIMTNKIMPSLSKTVYTYTCASILHRTCTLEQKPFRLPLML